MKQIFIKSKRVRVMSSAKRITAGMLCITLLLSVLSATTTFAQSNITYAEYYLDQDPGLSLATPINITAGTNVQNVAVNLNMSPLKSGAHFFGTRARTATGVWSMNHYWIFFKPYDVVLSPAALTNITKVEYYVDTDPGIGNGNSVSVTPATNLSDITFNVDPLPLGVGLHIIGSRAMSANGNWSSTNYWLFNKPYSNLTPASISNVNYFEYYIDNDPGIGRATPVAVSAALDIADVNFPVNITNTANGTHLVGARAKDAGGKWSMTYNWLFVKPYNNINAGALANVSAVEYYLDYDPGTGKGTPVPITAATNLADLTFNVDLTDVVGGAHFVNVRAKDANGRWSFVNAFEFTKPGTPPTLTTLVSANTFCAGTSLTVGYQLSTAVPFKSDNKFVAQLSDQSGSFLNPRDIGSLAITNDAGSFSCVIPADAAQSSAYRIRVITTNQTIIGANNGANITIYQLPQTPSITSPTGDTVVCQGNTFQLTSTANNYSAQWLLNGNPIANATSYSYSISSFAAANAGAYSLRLTNAGSCNVVSPVKNISINTNVPPTPSITPNGNVGICLGDSKTLTSSVAGNNQWFRNGVLIAGATGNSYNVTSAGTYTVQTSNGACTQISSNNTVVTVGVPPTKPTLTTSGPTAFCQNGNVTFTSSAFAGNQWYKDGQPVSGSTSTTYTATQSGFYKVSVVNGSCEIFSDSVQVIVTPNVVASVTLAASTNNVPEGTSITFTATPINGGSSPQYTFRVNNTVVQTGSSNTYTSAALTNGSSVYVSIVGNAPCSPNNTANSNTITVTFSNPIVISGRISHPLGMVIPTVKTRISNGTTDSTITDGQGNYSFNLLQQRNYTIAPAKNNDDIKSKGVNVLDVLQVQSHILNKTLLGSPYKIIAADVNSDNNVNIFDVLGMKRLILGIDTTFSGNKLWSFIDTTYSFPNPLNPFPYASSKSYINISAPFINQNYFGVKLGDVNYDWTPTAGQNREHRNTPVQLYYDTVFAEKGDVVRLRIRVKNFTELLGLQFTLGFNNSSFSFAGIENKQLLFEHNEKFSDKGAITFIWADAANGTKTMTDGSALFDILLKKKQYANSEDISIDPAYTPAIAFGKGYESYSIVKGQGVILEKVRPTPVVSIDRLEVSPNPSQGLVRVTITSKEARKITLVVSDVTGRVVLQKRVNLVQGNNEMRLNIHENAIVVPGMYYLRANGLEDVAPKELLITNR